MKLFTRWWSIILGGLLLVLGSVLILRHEPTVYPTPETETAFLQHYSPRGVEALFLSEAQSRSSSDHSGGMAGKKSAKHEKGFEDYFVIKREKWMPLMESLATDFADQLRASGANILDSSGDPRQGFRFQYTSGNTFGDATIAPLDVIDPTHPPLRLSPEQIPVRCRVTIQEEWFRVKPGLITMRVEGHIH